MTETPEMPSHSKQQSSRKTTSDSLISGLSFMLLANVLQRGVGFCRNLFFCLFLSQEELGLWALASSFFVLAAPLSVLGLPGTFGRFVETYRLNGSLHLFLKQVAAVSAMGTLFMVGLLTVLPSYSSHLVFGCSLSSSTMMLLAMTLLAVILFNATTELFGGLRRPQVVSAMHTTSSLSFTAISLVGLALYNDWRVVLGAFGVASIAGLIPAGLSYATFTDVPTESEPVRSRQIWKRILPYAVSIWCMNLLTNLFDVVDRYALLYFSSSSTVGQSIVGQYHSGRIMPLLLSSITLMLSSMLLPYLAADWESQDRTRVTRSLRLTYKLSIFFFFVLSLGSMAIGPLVFEGLLQGRYSGGMSVMPLALVHCCWMAQASLMHNYFWCRERGRIVGTLIGIGLVANLMLNYFLVPLWGLHGAMLATCLSGGLILIATLLMLKRDRIELGQSCFVLSILPASLLFGTFTGAIAIAVLVALASRTNFIFSTDEKQSIDASLRPVLSRFGMQSLRIWPRTQQASF